MVGARSAMNGALRASGMTSSAAIGVIRSSGRYGRCTSSGPLCRVMSRGSGSGLASVLGGVLRGVSRRSDHVAHIHVARWLVHHHVGGIGFPSNIKGRTRFVSLLN